MRKLVVLAIVLLAACDPVVDAQKAGTPSAPQARFAPAQVSVESEALTALINQFAQVSFEVKQVARTHCRASASNRASSRASRAKCNFQVSIDTRADAAPNAYQTEDRNGRPIIAFTLSLVAQMRNRDEMAFILGHEMAHHIKGHLAVKRAGILTGALTAGLEARLDGASAEDVRRAQSRGALREIQSFTKAFELEADALGAVIAHQAGYDPILGSQFFYRIRDPRHAFLATHPGNAQRLATVRAAVAGL